MILNEKKVYEALGRTQVHVDYHTPPWQRLLGVNYDGNAMGKALKEANVDSVTLFAKDYFGMAFYDTNVGFRQPHLQKDILKETVEGCHRHGVKVFAYFSLALDTAAGEVHPDWIQVNSKGVPAGNYKDGAVSYLCTNSSYMEENLIPMVIEAITNYDLDGLFFDELYTALDSCSCPNCVRNMKLRGLDPDNPEDRMYFRSLTCDNAAERLTRTIQHYKPDMAIVYNPTIKILGQLDRLVENENFICVGGHETGLGYINMKMEARHVRNYDRPILGMTGVFHMRWGDFGTVKHEAQLTYEVAEMLSHHFMISIGDHQMPHGEVEQAKYDVIGKVCKLVKDLNLPLKAKPVYDVAIIHPGIYDGQQIREGESKSESIRAEWPMDNGVTGATKFLCDTHQQFEVLSDPQAVRLLDKLNTIILPESLNLSDELCDKIRHFVAKGGTMIATGVTSLHKGSFQLADVMGVEFLNEPAYSFTNSPYARLLDYTEGVPEGIDMKLYSCPINVRQADDAEIKGYLVAPVASDLHYTRSYCGGPAENLLCEPAVICHRFGKGTTIYIANDIFRSYYKFGYYAHRNFLSNIMKSVQKNRVLEADCTSNFHFNLMQCEDGIYLHTIQHYAEDAGAFVPRANCYPPKQDVEVSVNCPGITNIVAVNDTQFTYEHIGQGVKIHMKGIGQYHVLKLINR